MLYLYSNLHIEPIFASDPGRSGHFHLVASFNALTGIPAVPFKEPLPVYAPRTQLSSGSITFDLNVTMS
jgi:hypothetical protein